MVQLMQNITDYNRPLVAALDIFSLLKIGLNLYTKAIRDKMQKKYRLKG